MLFSDLFHAKLTMPSPRVASLTDNVLKFSHDDTRTVRLSGHDDTTRAAEPVRTSSHLRNGPGMSVRAIVPTDGDAETPALSFFVADLSAA